MKFGYHTESWGWKKITPHSFPLVLKQISDAGFKGFETHDVDLLPFLKDKKKFLDILSERETQLASIHVAASLFEIANPLIHPWGWFKNFRSRIWWQWTHIPKIVKFAASFGCKKLVIVGGEIRKEGIREKDYVKMAKMLNKLGKICNDSGVEAAYHPQTRFIGGRRSELAKICDLTDPALVHLTLDTGHCVAAGGNLVEVIRTYHKRISHIHFRDFKNGTFVETGEGTINFSKITKLLKSIGYHDWIIIENDWRIVDSAGTTPFQSAKKAKKYIDLHLSNYQNNLRASESVL